MTTERIKVMISKWIDMYEEEKETVKQNGEIDEAWDLYSFLKAKIEVLNDLLERIEEVENDSGKD